MLSKEQTRQIADLLKASGVELKKNQTISLTIKTLIDAGMALDEAVDLILGEGTFRSIVSGAYELTFKKMN